MFQAMDLAMGPSSLPSLTKLKPSPATHDTHDSHDSHNIHYIHVTHDTTLVLCATDELLDSTMVVRWRNAFSEYIWGADSNMVVYVGDKLTSDQCAPNVCIYGNLSMLQRDDPVFEEIAKHAPYTVLIDGGCANSGVSPEVLTYLVDTFVTDGYVVKPANRPTISGARHVAYAQLEDKDLELVQYPQVVGQCKINGTKDQVECFDNWFASVAKAVEDQRRKMNTILFISAGLGVLELQASDTLDRLFFGAFDRIICIDPFTDEAVAKHVETQFRASLPHITTHYLYGFDAYDQLTLHLTRDANMKIGVVGAINYNIEQGVTQYIATPTPTFVFKGMINAFTLMQRRVNDIKVVTGSINQFGTHNMVKPIEGFIWELGRYVRHAVDAN